MNQGVHMKLTHKFRHLDASDSLKKYCDQRILEACRFLLKDGHGSVQYSKSQHMFSVDVTINTHERFFKASASNMDIYAAADSVVAKLEKQFLKIRKTYKNHKRPELSKEGRLKRQKAV
jgi:putative sigma-54 modulation protein